ncbi:hypothetical protein C8J57DRAFT_1227696 [Mycena rebaudengoi]|nr:hypothetical protein C8J57DRAFT_1227696 [Mycena rebaudengoi]
MKTGDRRAEHASILSVTMQPRGTTHTPPPASPPTRRFRTPLHILHRQHVVGRAHPDKRTRTPHLDTHMWPSPLQTRDEGEARARLISRQVRGDYRAREKEALRARSTDASSLAPRKAWGGVSGAGEPPAQRPAGSPLSSMRERRRDAQGGMGRRRGPQDREWGARRRGGDVGSCIHTLRKRGYMAREPTHLVLRPPSLHHPDVRLRRRYHRTHAGTNHAAPLDIRLGVCCKRVGADV